MRMVWSPGGSFRRVPYADEADLEAAIIEVRRELFGANRIYLDVKKKIGVRGTAENIPDGYVIDLTGAQPRLYVVENELAAHDPLRHVAVQILQFSLSFEAEPRKVKGILYDALQTQPDAKQRCEEYAAARDLRNLDNLLDHLVHEVPFTALVIIDEIPPTLESLLQRKLRFGVEVLELARFENAKGERVYGFDPFLEEYDDTRDSKLETEPDAPKPVDPAEIDTLVVPARLDGFKETFLGENRWYEIRVGAPFRLQIKHIAAYQVAPISAITHVAPVSTIEPWKDSGKFVVNFSSSAEEINPIRLVKGGRVSAPQSLRYTSMKRLLAAKTLDDLW